MTWDPAWLESSVDVRSLLAWRGVEAQHVVATMRLVDTPAEQDLLEQLLETSKPPPPKTARPKHYLLTTPFRYRPQHASRFRPPHTQGQWYGAESLQAACAEVAYWRHRFLMDSEGLRTEVLLTEHSFFQARVRGTAIDLMAQPWRQCRALWTRSSDYSATQAVASAAAEHAVHAVQWIAYESVRAPSCRCAVVMDANALSEPTGGLDRTLQTWRCKTTQRSVMFAGPGDSFAWNFDG
ncbi:MAG: RES family NAD+ phosphorylase [Simplicispira suum]|uniref:RES family NAD+ phosphorylase n=1 Tax=Simplicispira suum TaxID=2109915 RepID=UPI001C6B2F6E|nr:RES family NAD+ phosphorylase [Simplicispira suum]MBW7831829.1 RES family NAD+ phosphorylase [Simplicispira suum]